MPGEIKRLIDTIIEKRAQGNRTIETTTKIKLMMKGIKADSFTLTSPDDTEIIQKIRQIAVEMGVTL